MKIEEVVGLFFMLPKNINGHNDFDVVDIMIALKRVIKKKLNNDSGEGVEHIFSEIFRLKKEGLLDDYQNVVFYLMSSIKNFVSEEHLERISQILFWDEILMTEERSTRSTIIETLEKIGSDSAVEILKKLAVEIKKVLYKSVHGRLVASPEKMAQLDQDIISRALVLIEERKYCSQ